MGEMVYSCCVRRTACIAALAAAFAGTTGHAARADDGAPQLPDATAIVRGRHRCRRAQPRPFLQKTAWYQLLAAPIPPAVPTPPPAADPG